MASMLKALRRDLHVRLSGTRLLPLISALAGLSTAIIRTKTGRVLLRCQGRLSLRNVAALRLSLSSDAVPGLLLHLRSIATS